MEVSLHQPPPPQKPCRVLQSTRGLREFLATFLSSNVWREGHSTALIDILFTLF